MLELDVNGQRHELDVDPATPLAWVLRDTLGLVGVRVGCGFEQCGACHVLVDGESVASCGRPAAAFTGRRIRTVEDLGGDDAVQLALLAHNAGQCGYCLSGIVMSARALFDHDPHPDDTAIRTALAPHLCRCGAQPRILRALRELAATAP